MSKQRGRPRTEKHNRVKVTITLDPDLKEWTEGKKRSDMVNRLLRALKSATIDRDIISVNVLGHDFTRNELTVEVTEQITINKQK